jgi:hypothetical protein
MTNPTTNGNLDTLHFTLTLPDNTTDHRIILGNFNCTLNHHLDSDGYETDPHPKSRKLISGFIDNEEFVDSFRHFNPNKTEYTYRNNKGDLRDRLNYGLVSPSLIKYVKKVSQTAHNYDVSDHASFSITLDITESKRGKGIFRCSPTIHKNPEYEKLIRNTVRKSVYDSLKETPSLRLSQALFESRMSIEEEYNSIINNIPDWKTEERKRTLNHTIDTQPSNEPTIEELLTNELDISKPTLLELTLNYMRNETIRHAKSTRVKNDYTEETLKEELYSVFCIKHITRNNNKVK